MLNKDDTLPEKCGYGRAWREHPLRWVALKRWRGDEQRENVGAGRRCGAVAHRGRGGEKGTLAGELEEKGCGVGTGR